MPITPYPAELPIDSVKILIQKVRDGTIFDPESIDETALHGWNVQGWALGTFLGTPDVGPVVAGTHPDLDELEVALKSVGQPEGLALAREPSKIDPGLIMLIIQAILKILEALRNR